MENSVGNKSVGSGIITMSVLYFVFHGFIVICLLAYIFFKNYMYDVFEKAGVGEVANTQQLAISLVTSLIIITTVILILCKKPIGAFLFIGIEILTSIYSAITTGVNIFTPIVLIFPALMIFFMYKKKDIYFVKQ